MCIYYGTFFIRRLVLSCDVLETTLTQRYKNPILDCIADTILKIVETRYDLHQCTNLCSQDAHEKFLKIARAYEVLKDEESRKK